MFANVKLPHAALVALSGLAVLLTWLTAQQTSGAVNLPAWGVTLLSLATMLLGLFSPSAAGGSSAAALAAKRGFARVKMLAVVSLIGLMGVVGCSWFTANKQTVLTDVGSTASCVLAQVFQGNEDPLSITVACAPATLADIVEIVASLLNFYAQPTDGGAPAADAGPAPAPPSSDFVSHLHRVHDKAMTLQAAGH